LKKILRYAGLQRWAGEFIADISRWGNGALRYQLAEKRWEKCHQHCFHVSKTMIATEFIMPPYLSVVPLKVGNYIYKILRQ